MTDNQAAGDEWQVVTDLPAHPDMDSTKFVAVTNGVWAFYVWQAPESAQRVSDGWFKGSHWEFQEAAQHKEASGG